MQPSEKFTSIGLGEILWDIYDENKYLGGAPANFALHIQNLGHQGIIISRIGKDLNGTELLDTLHDKGIETSGIQIDTKKSTGTVVVKLDKDGMPTFHCSHDTAFDYLDTISLGVITSKKVNAVLFGTLAQRNPVSRKTIQSFIQTKPAELILFDMNLRGITKQTNQLVQFAFEHANMIKMNDSEMKYLQTILNIHFSNAGDMGNYLIETYQLDLVCITLGKFGALLCSKENQMYSPGFQVSVTDTTGSGDAFIAAFIMSYLEKRSLIDCLEFANALGALVATKNGAVPEYTIKNIDDVIHGDKQRHIDEKYNYLL